jgi:hypothetical protein
MAETIILLLLPLALCPEPGDELAFSGGAAIINTTIHEPRPEQWAVGYACFYFFPTFLDGGKIIWTFKVIGLIRFY